MYIAHRRIPLTSSGSNLATSFPQYITPSAALVLLSCFSSSSFPNDGIRPYPTLIVFLARSIRPFIPLPPPAPPLPLSPPNLRTSSRAFSKHARACARLPRDRPRIRSALLDNENGTRSVDEAVFEMTGREGVVGREVDVCEDWESASEGASESDRVGRSMKAGLLTR